MKVNEIFGPTIQGEGKSVGRKVMFVRLVLCNLYCIWCDTPYTWNWIGTKFAHPKKFDKTKEVHEMSSSQITKALLQLSNEVRAVVISGGEPLVQQKELFNLLEILKSFDYWVEVETNGTIVPTPEVESLVDQFNCSPKLENSTIPYAQRIKGRALEALQANNKTCFKFVVGNKEDMKEILELIKEYKLTQVYLMPLGQTRVELTITSPLAHSLAKEHNLTFSSRLHVELFGEKRGV